MSDHIEAIITGLENCCAECADQAEHIAYAINEHVEVIITTQADDAAHDAAVAARTLHLTAENARLRAGIEYLRGEVRLGARTNAEPEAVHVLQMIHDDLVDLLDPGETDD